jgi:hypothetical protein
MTCRGVHWRGFKTGKGTKRCIIVGFAICAVLVQLSVCVSCMRYANELSVLGPWQIWYHGVDVR